MSRVLRFEEHYPVDADRLFALVSDLDVLEAVMHPWLRVLHLPSGPVRSGQVVDIAFSVLGLFPDQPYRMRIALCDPAARRLRSEEAGMGLRALVHEIEVTPQGDGAKLADRVEIEAGAATPAFVLCARLLHRWRHRVRLRLLAEDAGGALTL